MNNDKEFLNHVYQKYNAYEEKEMKEAFYTSSMSQKHTRRVLKSLTVFLLTIGLTIGITYAGVYTYQKIWKTPKSTTWEEAVTVTDEEKKEVMEEAEAKKLALETLKNMGYPNEEVRKVKLEKDIVIGVRLYWTITTYNKIEISIDAYTGKLAKWTDESFRDARIKPVAKEEEVKKVAKEMYLQLGYQEGEYELADVRINRLTTEPALWTADFCKKYDGIYNDYQCIRIMLIPEIKKPRTIIVFDYPFENNPIQIEKEKAEQIAEEEIMKMIQAEITNIESSVAIKQMNSYVYQTQNPLTSGNEMYQTEALVRKVWDVKIQLLHEDPIRILKILENSM